MFHVLEGKEVSGVTVLYVLVSPEIYRYMTEKSHIDFSSNHSYQHFKSTIQQGGYIPSIVLGINHSVDEILYDIDKTKCFVLNGLTRNQVIHETETCHQDTVLMLEILLTPNTHYLVQQFLFSNQHYDDVDLIEMVLTTFLPKDSSFKPYNVRQFAALYALFLKDKGIKMSMMLDKYDDFLSYLKTIR